MTDDDMIEHPKPEEDVSTTEPPRRELIGHFSTDTPSRDIAKAVIAARRNRQPKDSQSRPRAKDEPKRSPAPASHTPQQTKDEKPPDRTLVGHFSANTDVDAFVDMIIATVPLDERPPEDRPNRIPKRP